MGARAARFVPGVPSVPGVLSVRAAHAAHQREIVRGASVVLARRHSADTVPSANRCTPTCPTRTIPPGSWPFVDRPRYSATMPRGAPPPRN